MCRVINETTEYILVMNECNKYMCICKIMNETTKYILGWMNAINICVYVE